MAQESGNYDPFEHLRTLNQLAQSNLDEHERIWKSVEGLRDSHLKTLEGVDQLTRAIRDLIDRIPPDNLREVEPQADVPWPIILYM